MRGGRVLGGVWEEGGRRDDCKKKDGRRGEYRRGIGGL